MSDTKPKTVTINAYLLTGLVVALLGISAFGSYHFTSSYFKNKELKSFADDQTNLICQARIQKGHVGDVKSDYYLIETSAKDGDCAKFIDYKNLPDDTESVYLGF